MATDTLRDNRMLRRLKVFVFTFVGAALMISALCWGVSIRRFVARAVSAPGVVVKLNAGGSHPEVRFTTMAGEVVDYPRGGDNLGLPGRRPGGGALRAGEPGG